MKFNWARLKLSETERETFKDKEHWSHFYWASSALFWCPGKQSSLISLFIETLTDLLSHSNFFLPQWLGPEIWKVKTRDQMEGRRSDSMSEGTEEPLLPSIRTGKVQLNKAVKLMGSSGFLQDQTIWLCQGRHRQMEMLMLDQSSANHLHQIYFQNHHHTGWISGTLIRTTVCQVSWRRC